MAADVELGLLVVVVCDCTVEVVTDSELLEALMVIDVLVACVVCCRLEGDELLTAGADPAAVLGQIAEGPSPVRNTVRMLVPSSCSFPHALLTVSTMASSALTHP